MRGFVITVAVASIVIPPLMSDPVANPISAEFQQPALDQPGIVLPALDTAAADRDDAQIDARLASKVANNTSNEAHDDVSRSGQ